jgi:hypothetical protein
LRYWGNNFNPEKVITSGKPVYLYLQKNTNSLYTRTIRKLFESYKGFTVKKKLLFENPQNGEAILQLFFDRTKQQVQTP